MSGYGYKRHLHTMELRSPKLINHIYKDIDKNIKNNLKFIPDIHHIGLLKAHNTKANAFLIGFERN